jgi:hypothetical protein
MEKGQVIPENIALYENYKKAFLEAAKSFGLKKNILSKIKSPSPFKYSIYPSLEVTCNNASDSLEIPTNLRQFIKDIFPNKSSFAKRVKATEDSVDMFIEFEEKPKTLDPTIQILPLLIFSDGNCSYHKITTTNGERQVSVEKKLMTSEVMKDFIRLPKLISSHYLGTLSFNKMQHVVFERDIIFHTMVTGQCPFAK